MESNRFDALTRGISETNSRRGMLKTLAAGGLGLGLVRIGPDAAVAGKKHKKDKKKKKRKQQDNQQPVAPQFPLSTPCSESSQCEGGLICQETNAMNNCYESTEKRCCIPEGGHCEKGCECCGVGVICNGNFCQST